MHDAEMLIPITFFAMVFAIFYIRSRENMALIERGINPRQNNTVKSRPTWPLRWGLVLVGAGIGLVMAYMFDIFVLQKETYIIEDGVRIQRETEPIYFGLVGICGGLGLLISYIIERVGNSVERRRNRENREVVVEQP